MNFEQPAPASQPYTLEITKKKRDEYLIEIRTQTREEILATKRLRNLKKKDMQTEEINMMQIQTEEENIRTLDDEEEQKIKYIDVCLKMKVDIKQFDSYVQAINSKDILQQHFGVIALRKLVSFADPPLQRVIDAGLLPRLVSFMDMKEESHLQLEAAWTLANISSGTKEQTKSVVTQGAIPRFIQLLKNQKPHVSEQALWAIGNIGGEDCEFRELIFSYGGLYPLCQILNKAKDEKDDECVKNAIWALSNICRGKPKPAFDKIAGAIPTLARIIKEDHELDHLSDALWSLAPISEERNYLRLQKIVQENVIPSLVRHIENPYLNVLVPALRIIGNILSGEEAQTNMVIQEERFMGKFCRLIYHEKKIVKREIYWGLSSIAAGTPAHVDLILSYENIVKEIIKAALSEGPEIRCEAALVVSNLVRTADQGQIVSMVQQGILDCLATMINDELPDIIISSLKGLKAMFNWGQTIADQEGTENKVLDFCESKGVLKKLEVLQKHKNDEIYQLALDIIEAHYTVESEI